MDEDEFDSIPVEVLPQYEWEKDTDTKSCRKCKLQFTFTKRRHHCRVCGKIFCDQCAPFSGLFPGTEHAVRACDDCIQATLKKAIKDTTKHEHNRTKLDDAAQKGEELGSRKVEKAEHVSEHQMSQQMKLMQLRQQSDYNAMVEEENRNKQYRILKGEGVKREIDMSVLPEEIRAVLADWKGLSIRANVIHESEWVKDSLVNSCDDCCIVFSQSVRRHHCRVCGHIYCEECTPSVGLHPNTPQREESMPSHETHFRMCRFCVLKTSMEMREAAEKDIAKAKRLAMYEQERKAALAAKDKE